MDNQDIAVKLASHDAALTNMEKRLDKVEDTVEQIHELTISIQKVADKQDSIVEKMDSLSTDVSNLTREPGDNWKKVKMAIITGIVSCVVTAAMAVLLTLIK